MKNLLNKINVFIVDDDIDDIKKISTWLDQFFGEDVFRIKRFLWPTNRPAGYHPTKNEYDKIALESIKNGEIPDIIISDIYTLFSPIDGVILYQEVKKKHNIIFFFVTNNPTKNEFNSIPENSRFILDKSGQDKDIIKNRFQQAFKHVSIDLIQSCTKQENAAFKKVIEALIDNQNTDFKTSTFKLNGRDILIKSLFAPFYDVENKQYELIDLVKLIKSSEKYSSQYLDSWFNGNSRHKISPQDYLIVHRKRLDYEDEEISINELVLSQLNEGIIEKSTWRCRFSDIDITLSELEKFRKIILLGRRLTLGLILRSKNNTPENIYTQLTDCVSEPNKGDLTQLFNTAFFLPLTFEQIHSDIEEFLEGTKDIPILDEEKKFLRLLSQPSH